MTLHVFCALAIAAMALAGLLTPQGAGATEIPLSTPGSEGWRPLVFRGVANQTRYTLESFGGVEIAKAESNCGASGLVLRLDAINLDQTPLLSWRWRVDRGLDLLEEQTKAEDDFAARVYIMFELDKSRTSTFQRLRHRLAELIYGEEIPASALNFVWTSRLPAGTVWNNPFESSRCGRSIPRTLSLAGPATARARDHERFRQFVSAHRGSLRGFQIPEPPRVGRARC